MVKEVQNNELDKADKIKDVRVEIPTVLSLLEHDQAVMSDVQKEVLEEEISELPPIKEGDINVSGIYAYDLGDKIEVKVYIRNGLSKNVNFEYIPFMIVNSKGETLAYQLFDMKELGEIPAGAARPWKLFFDKKNVYVNEIPMDDWEIAFNSSLKLEESVTTEYENLPEEIELEDRIVFDKFLEELPQLKLGEFSISTFSVGIQQDGNILVTVVVRNGSDKPVKLEKVPVTVRDAARNVIRSSAFELDNFVVNPFKAKICNFAFPTTLQLEQDIALDNWSVSFKLEQVAQAPEDIKEEKVEE